MDTIGKGEKGIGKGGLEGPLLTIREVSRLLCVHSNTLRRWNAKGLIRSYRVGLGHQRRFKAEDVTALLKER